MKSNSIEVILKYILLLLLIFVLALIGVVTIENKLEDIFKSQDVIGIYTNLIIAIKDLESDKIFPLVSNVFVDIIALSVLLVDNLFETISGWFERFLKMFNISSKGKLPNRNVGFGDNVVVLTLGVIVCIVAISVA